MALFQYPKGLHARTLTPRQFKRYRTYKRYLQTEFSRVCVYCRQPDSSAPNLNFGVDHYKPKDKFVGLLCTYSNLYYCCGNCNSRKNNDWPTDEKVGPYVVNPCDHDMAAHIRFNAATGKMEPRSSDGQHMEELLQLNEPASVNYRLGSLRIIKLLEGELRSQQVCLSALQKKKASGELSDEEYVEVHNLIVREIASLQLTLQAQQGTLPLPPLRKSRGNIQLL